MAKMLIAGTTYDMPIWLKGRLLTDSVETTEDITVLSVESGTEAGKRWNVRHDGIHALSCDCPARVNCCHMMAVERYLALASDVQAHLDDMSEDEDEQMMGDLAEQIIRAEQDRKIRAGIEEDLLAELAQYEREVATAPAFVEEALESVEDIDGGMMAMIDAMQAEKARKLAAQARYREAWPEDFSYYHGAA